MPDDHAEILRIRNRLHDIDALLAASNWTLTDQGRRIRELNAHVWKIQRVVDEMSKAEEVADAVTDALHKERAVWLSTPRKAAAAVLALLLAAPALHDLVNWLRWF